MGAKIKFGTDGWRGVMADDFTFDHVRIVAQAIAQHIINIGQKEKGIVIGYDNRFLATQFAETVAEVMVGNGIDVLLTKEATPTPVVAFAVKQYQTAGAVMLTASHNPPEHNGMKFIPHYAGPALPYITDEIVTYIEEIQKQGNIEEYSFEYGLKVNKVKIINPKSEYLQHIKEIINENVLNNSSLSIVVDPMFGAGIHFLDEVLKDYHFKVTAIHNKRDPLFGGSLPEPTENNLNQLKKKMQQEKADLGLALDGDADRLAVIDQNGQYISPNQIIYLLMQYLIDTRGFNGTVARTVATTHMIDRIAGKYGIEVDETPVGFKYIGKSMVDKDAFIGGEESGGISIKGHIPEKDGILACLLVVEMAAATGKSPTELIHDLQDQYGTIYSKRLDKRCSVAQKGRILEMIKSYDPEYINGKKVVKRITIDGLKLVTEDDSWVLIRPSGTESLFRIYAEGEREEKVDEIQSEVCGYLGLE